MWKITKIKFIEIIVIEKPEMDPWQKDIIVGKEYTQSNVCSWFTGQ